MSGVLGGDDDRRQTTSSASAAGLGSTFSAGTGPGQVYGGQAPQATPEVEPVTIDKPILLPKPEPVAPTPAERRVDDLVNAEQQRTSRERLAVIQRQLALETSQRSNRFGIRSLFGSLGSGRSGYLGSG